MDDAGTGSAAVAHLPRRRPRGARRLRRRPAGRGEWQGPHARPGHCPREVDGGPAADGSERAAARSPRAPLGRHRAAQPAGPGMSDHVRRAGTDPRRGLLERIDADRDRLVRFLQDFTRIDTSNPPGDTRAGAAFIGDFLEAAGLPYRASRPRTRCRTSWPARASAGPGGISCSTGTSTYFPAATARAGRVTRSPATSPTGGSTAAAPWT